jgi:four helix bundle protein
MATAADIERLKKRTKEFSVRVFKLCRALPKNREADVIARQILRSASSVAANHRSLCRSRSRADFIAKLGIVIEEADETLFWLEYLVDCEVMPAEKLSQLMQEANELTAIFVSARETSRTRKW